MSSKLQNLKIQYDKELAELNKLLGQQATIHKKIDKTQKTLTNLIGKIVNEMYKNNSR